MESGQYCQQDPIGLHSCVYNLYAHVRDLLEHYDPLGLDWNYVLKDSSGDPYYIGRASDNQSMSDVARRHSATKDTDGSRFGPGDSMHRTTPMGTPKDTVRGVEQHGVSEKKTLGRGSDRVRGNKSAGISERKQRTPAGRRRMDAGCKALNGRKASETPSLEEPSHSDCGKR